MAVRYQGYVKWSSNGKSFHVDPTYLLIILFSLISSAMVSGLILGRYLIYDVLYVGTLCMESYGVTPKA